MAVLCSQSSSHKETMKIRLVVALVVFAIRFVVPALAQEENAVDPEVRQQIEGAYKKRLDAYNKHDAAAIAALFTQDAIQMDATGFGDAFGQEAIKKKYEAGLASSSVVSPRILQLYAVGSEICGISEFTVQRQQIRHAVTIYVREADEWKIRMQYLTW
jgi:ketosteroid isomerase-like protein